MLNVTKKELTPRQFTPYEFTITVATEDDHKRLIESCNSMKEKDRYWFKKIGPFEYICEQILSHVK